MASQDLSTDRDVTNDQYTRRDPTRQYGVPETGGREIEGLPGRTTAS